MRWVAVDSEPLGWSPLRYWRTTDELRANWQEDRRWSPQWTDEQRATGYAAWRKAVTRTLDWAPVSG